MFVSFLGWLDPTTWLSGVENGIMGSIVSGLRTMFFTITEVIYGLIIFLYDMFEILCTSRILDNGLLSEFTNRVGIILGLIMLFNVIFAFIKMLIDPELIENKESGAAAIVKKTLLTIVMLGVSNFVFLQLYNIQSIIIKDHVIDRLLLPISIENTEDFGKMLSSGLLTSFYQLQDLSDSEIVDPEAEDLADACEGYYTAFRNQIISDGKFDFGYTCLNESVEVVMHSGAAEGDYNQEVYLIYFNWFLCIAAGIGVAYLLAMYCIKVGVRMIQLAFLEIISPMAIVSYLSPKKETMFNKWTKVYFATYIDVFIRIAIINFIILIIATLFTSDEAGMFTFMSSLGPDIDTKTKSFFMVVIILALLTFAKKAPDLLKDLFPAGASKLGLGASLKDVVGLQKGTKIGAGILGGVAGGAAVGLLAGKPLGAIGGALKGGLSGFKGQGLKKTAAGAWTKQSKANAELAKVRMNGGSWLGHKVAGVQKAVGMNTAADIYDDEKATLEKQNSAYNQVASKFDDAKKRAKGKIIDGDLEKFKGTDTEIKAQKALEAQNKIELLKASVANLDKNKLGEEEYNKRIASLDKNELGEEEYNRRIASLDKNELGAEEYNRQLELLNTEITAATTNATTLMDEAIESYINDGKDIVTTQKMDEAQAVINSNKQYEGFNNLQEITNFKSFKKASDESLGKVSENNIKLTQNAQEGKAARANAGK